MLMYKRPRLMNYGGAETTVGALEQMRSADFRNIAAEEKKGYVPGGDRWYFNCSIKGNSSLSADGGNQPTQAIFDQTSQTPLLEKASDWSLSIVRFKVPTSYIPLFNYTPGSCIVSIKVRGGLGAGNYSSTVVINNPADAAQPNAIWYVQDFVDAVNSAISTAYNAAVGAGFGGTPNFPPQISYSGSTGLMTITYEQTWWEPDAINGANAGQTAALYFNFNLYEGFFDSFQGIYQQAPYPANLDVLIVLKQIQQWPAAASPQIVAQSGALTSNGAATSTITWANSPVRHGLSVNGAGVNQQVIISGAVPNSYNGTYVVTSVPDAFTFTVLLAPGTQILTSPATGAPTMVAIPFGSQIPGQRNSITQETPSVASWDNFVSLRFTTASIPVRPESLPSASSNTGPLTSARAVLTDFNPVFSDQVDTRNYIQYVPTGEYRRVDLINDEPLRRFDLQALWVDRSGVEHPIYIPNGETLDVKILFERKHRLVEEITSALQKATLRV